MALPEYPEMKPLEIADRPAIESCTHRLPCSSDHNFTSLWMWNIDAQARVARIATNLVIQLADYHTHEPCLTLIGDDNVASAAAQALALGTQRLEFIPEFVADQLPTDQFIVEHDRDQDDYVVDVVRLSTLRGRSLQPRRQEANHCVRTLGDRLSVAHSVEHPEIALLELFDRWASSRGKTDEPATADERRAIERLVEAWHDLDLVVTGLYDGDRLFAAAILEVLPDGAIGHYEKADISYRGGFPLLARSYCEHLASRGVHELNIEQDAGIEGLRRSKLGWRPVRMVRKYRATLRHGVRSS